jgi:retron-type reverse transcriptase
MGNEHTATIPPIVDIAHVERLRLAWDKVARRGAGPGIDRVTVAAYAQGLEERLDLLARRLARGDWRASPGRRIELAEDPDRPIVVSTVEDRIVQRALVDALTPAYEALLSEAARAYRPGLSLQGTLARVDRWLTEGRRWFVRTDITRFFESIDRERLLAQMATDGVDAVTVRRVRELLRAGLVEGLAWHDPEGGIPQGSALSPLLSNVYLRGSTRRCSPRDTHMCGTPTTSSCWRRTRPGPATRRFCSTPSSSSRAFASTGARHSAGTCAMGLPTWACGSTRRGVGWRAASCRR